MNADVAPGLRTKNTSPTTFESRSPADGTLVGCCTVSTEQDVGSVVDTARRAFEAWSSLPVASRSRHLRQWRAEIWSRRAEFAELIHRETGKPLEDALLEVVLTLEHIAWNEKNAARLLQTRRVRPGLLLANSRARIDRVPLGVVGVIGPWNYPLYTANGAVSAALAAGNTVVLKPSEHTPGVAVLYAQAFAAANPGIQVGVLSVVTGFGDTGVALCESGVDKIAFTGSTATGTAVMERCARTLTPVVLECGGKDPVIVAADADIAAAARAVAWGAFTNAGQTCVGVERVYVDEAVAPAFTAELVRHARRAEPGMGRKATYGPMTMPAQIDVVRRHVDAALAAGGRALFGGPSSIGSAVIGPIVLTDVPENNDAIREETFGPTVTVTTVSNVDDAVRRANDHQYALGASVFSRRHGDAIARQLSCGQVTVNSVIAFAGMGSVPMGGLRASGFGRVHGEEGFYEFCRTRSRVEKRWLLPGFDLTTLKRRPWISPVLDRVLGLRHRS